MLVDPYYKEIKNNLPRILSFYDFDKTSKTFGLGDRYHWAWGLIDFSNATYQGAVNGMAKLWVTGLWPYPTKKEDFTEKVFSIGMGVKKLLNREGMLSEAFPREGSYCVTALLAFDLLCSYRLLNKQFNKNQKKEWLLIIEKLVNIILRTEEEHAFISNHLATAAAALYRWYQVSKDEKAKTKSYKLIKKIIFFQSSEGWYKEYEGFDPGYQTLCTYYLVDFLRNSDDIYLLNSLKKSINFLWHFAHPDGSFGGIYGSRNTRFYFPSGISYLANMIPQASALSNYMKESIHQKKVITLSSLDESNLIPMFNCYCDNLMLSKDYKEKNLDEFKLPMKSNKSKRIYFKESGLIIDNTKQNYTIINVFKGGVVYHFNKNKKSLIDCGVAFKNKFNQIGTSQSFSKENSLVIENNQVSITSRISACTKKTPTVFQFILLRFLSLSIFRIRFLRESTKKLLVKLLITGKSNWPITNTRKIFFGKNIKIIDNSNEKYGYKKVFKLGEFVHIHMASKGYWQIQDEY